MHDDACQVREKSGQVEREKGLKDGRHQPDKLRFPEDVWQVVSQLGRERLEVATYRLLLVYEDVRSGKVKVGVVQVVGVPTARQKLGLLGRLHR